LRQGPREKGKSPHGKDIGNQRERNVVLRNVFLRNQVEIGMWSMKSDGDRKVVPKNVVLRNVVPSIKEK